MRTGGLHREHVAVASAEYRYFLAGHRIGSAFSWRNRRERTQCHFGHIPGHASTGRTDANSVSFAVVYASFHGSL